MGSLLDDAEDDERTRDGAPSGVSASRRRLLPGARLGGRFEILADLGEGGMGQVFRAWDGDRKTHVALKILGEIGPQAISDIKREFRAAGELVHPNLVRLHELFSDGADWFFTMDVVGGVTLPRLFGGEPPEIAVLRKVFRQLAEALRELHRAGTLHGDLKPSNFLVSEEDHQVVLLDFGLARPPGEGPEGEFAGTPAYMAPEQALGQARTEAADWYAFGVVLYEALAGDLPRRRPEAEKLDRAPPDLRALCLELLSLEPRARPSGDEVVRRVGEGPGTGPVPLPRPSRPVLIDRVDELAELLSALARTAEGTVEILLVKGASGIGKTALLERFVDVARRRGAIVLASRCRERESMAYKAMDGLVDDVASLLSGLAPAEVPALLPDGIAELGVLFPALRGVPAVGGLPTPVVEDSAVVRQRAIAALRGLVSNLRALGPVVLWIDDLQWSDEESAVLLSRILSGPEAVPVLLVGSLRSDEAGGGPLVRALLAGSGGLPSPPKELVIGPLAEAHAEALALEILATGADGAAQRAREISREAGGHPLFIAELAYSTAPGETAPAPLRTLSSLMSNRIAALPPSARKLLEVAAVSGVPRPRAVLRVAGDLAPADAEEALDLLRAGRLARSGGFRDQDPIDIHHDRIREIVLQNLSSEALCERHLSLARVLESAVDVRPEVVATHYEAAGEGRKAGGYWLAGAALAFEGLAFEHAAELYARGAALSSLSPEDAATVEVKRAEALAYSGKGALAAEVYLQVASRSPPARALELRRRAAEQLLFCGHIDAGFRVIDQVLAALGMRRTSSGRRALASIAVGRVLVRLRGLRHEKRPEAAVGGAELARVDASWTVACSLSVVDFLRGAEFQNRHLLLALRAGEPRRLLRALTLEISYAATPGVLSERRTRELLATAEALVHARADPAAAGLFALACGIAAYLQGRLEDSLRRCEEALGILGRTGAVWETVTARRFAIASMFFLGRMRRLSEFVPPLLSEADGTGNIYASMCFRSAYSTVAWLCRDQVDEARRNLDVVRRQWTGGGFQLSHYNLLVGDSLVDFYVGDAEGALARIREQWPRLEEAGIPRIGVLRVQLLQLRAASACAVASAFDRRGRGAEARELRVEARRFAARLRKDRLRRGRALADLVLAAADLAEGDRSSSMRRLASSARAFDEQGLALFGAAARTHLGLIAGGSVGVRLERAAAETLRAEGVADAARFVAMLAPGFGHHRARG